MMAGAKGLGGVMASVQIGIDLEDLDTNGHKKSVDSEAFTNHMRDGTDKDNRQDAIELKNQKISIAKEEQDKQDNIQNSADAANDTLNEVREKNMQKIFSMHGYEFSAEAMQEAAGDALSDFERLAREKGWDAEQSETIHDALLVLNDPNSTREEQMQALKDINKADPDYGREFAKGAKKITINSNENEIDPHQTATVAETERQAEIVSQIENRNDEGAFDRLKETPVSGTTKIFTDEVNNVGANAQSFALDDTPQVAVTDTAPDPFILDV